jgi:hypothetical protein
MAEKPRSPPELGMNYEGIDHIAMIAAPDAEEEFSKLGFKISPPFRLAGMGIERRYILTAPPEQPFGIALDVVVDEREAERSTLGRLANRAPGPRGPVYAVALRVADIAGAVEELGRGGVVASAVETIVHEGGEKVEYVAALPEPEECYVPLLLWQLNGPASAWYADREKAGMLNHALSLSRLDHLAATAPRQEDAKLYWEERLGIPQTGELTGGSGNFIRQFQIGDAIIELIGDAVQPCTNAASRPLEHDGVRGSRPRRRRARGAGGRLHDLRCSEGSAARHQRLPHSC